MLIKRKNFMAPKAGNVKKLGTSALGIFAVSMVAIAPAASANDTIMKDRTISVKFLSSDLAVNNGAQNVYAKLEKKAKSYCRRDSYSLSFLKQSHKECADDLLNQFIQSVNIPALNAYHLAQNT